MTTINASTETKEKFKTLRLKEQAKENKTISEDDFMKILMDKFEGKKK